MQRTKVSIEFARTSDLDEIALLSREYIEHGLGWRYTPRRLRTLAANRNKNIVVARAGTRLAGFGIMTYGEHNANLDLLAVRAEYRHRGAGRQIVNWLLEVARNAGIGNVFVQVRKLNGAAIGFYLELGFQAIDEIGGYYNKREAGVIMCKALRPAFHAT